MCNLKKITRRIKYGDKKRVVIFLRIRHKGIYIYNWRFTATIPKTYAKVNPLTADVVHARHDADVACSGCSASYMQNYVFLKEEKICYKMVYYYTLYLS